MELILINSYLNSLDEFRINPLKNIGELDELRTEIYTVIEEYVKKHKTEDIFTDILNHIALDVNDEIEKALEKLEHNQGVNNG